MTEDTENIVLELLRAIRSDIQHIKSDLSELKASDISIRKQLHSIQGDFLRQEQGIASIRVDIDKIKSRLNLVEA
ncbi:MAG: hypothetical protein V7731_01245 [Amphritea sp.]